MKMSNIDNSSLETMKKLWQQGKASTSAPENLRPVHTKKMRSSLARLFIPATALSVMFGAFVIYKLPDSVMYSEPATESTSNFALDNADFIAYSDDEELLAADSFLEENMGASENTHNAMYDSAPRAHTIPQFTQISAFSSPKVASSPVAKSVPVLAMKKKQAIQSQKPALNTNIAGAESLSGAAISEPKEMMANLESNTMTAYSMEHNQPLESKKNTTQAIKGTAVLVDQQWWLLSCESLESNNEQKKWKLPEGDWQAGTTYEGLFNSEFENKISNVSICDIACTP
jgi:hypothetical protein